MPVRGLAQYIEQCQDLGATCRVDLANESRCEGDALHICLELRDACEWLVQRCAVLPPTGEPVACEGVSPSCLLSASACSVCLGDYESLDASLTAFVNALRHAQVSPMFFVDVPIGAGLLDQCCPLRHHIHRARIARATTAVRAASSWCCSGTGSPPSHMCLPPLWLEQAIGTLKRLDCSTVFFEPHEQAPLWQPPLETSFIVSNNPDWCLIPGLRVVPFSGFDVESNFWPVAPGSERNDRLIVQYTSTEVLREALKLSSPPDSHSKAEPPVLKVPWNQDHLLWELALLCGTESTRWMLKRKKIYKQLQIDVSTDPVEQVAGWLRSRIFPVKVSRKEVLIEKLDDTLANIVKSDKEFSLALRFSRCVYARDVAGLQVLQQEWAELGGTSNWVNHQLSAPEDMLGPLRGAAIGAPEVFLEPFVEAPNSPSSWTILADLRRLIYSCMRSSLTENSPSHHGVSSRTIQLDQFLQGSLDALWSTWSKESRLKAFTRCIEHNFLASQGAGGMQGAIESLVWSDVETCFTSPTKGYLQSLFTYLVSLNLRSDSPQIVPHELDSLFCATVLSAQQEDPLSPLAGCPQQVQTKLDQLRVQVERLAAWAFQPPILIPVPARAARLAVLFQTTARVLNNLASVLGVNRADAGEAVPTGNEMRRRFEMLLQGSSNDAGKEMCRIMEPRTFFRRSVHFVALYCAGAHAEGELDVSVDGETPVRELASLRNEILAIARNNGDWVGNFISQLPKDMLQWPSGSGSQEQEEPIHSREELPIDKHRKLIIQHIVAHPVTCIEGDPGCGKSLRVPLYILEAEELNKSCQVRILCTQPRRVACIGMAKSVARALGEPVGETVGYKMLGDDLLSLNTRITFVTTNYLLHALTNDPSMLNMYTHLILDEAHERSMGADLLNFAVKMRMEEGRFRLVVMSATLPASLSSGYFMSAWQKRPPVYVGGSRFPVQVLYLEQLAAALGQGQPLSDHALTGVRNALKVISECGDVRAKGGERQDVVLNRGLFSLVSEIVPRIAKPGESILICLPDLAALLELREELEHLEIPDPSGTKEQKAALRVLMLHPLMPKAMQETVAFEVAPLERAQVILAWEIADSSLTIPNLRVVVDFGLQRCLVYDSVRQASRLKTTWVSQATCKQRAGRTGRLMPGLAIRLFTQVFHDQSMETYETPETLTAPSEQVFVNAQQIATKTSKSWDAVNLLRMCPNPPNTSSFADCAKKLDELGALEFNEDGTSVGSTVLSCLVSSLPLDAKLCRLIFFGCLFGEVCDAVIMAAALASRDPFVSPNKNQTQSFQDSVQEVQKGFAIRHQYDGGHLSEPLMLRALFLDWLAGLHREVNDQYKQDPTKLTFAGYVRRSRSLADDIVMSSIHCTQIAAMVAEVGYKLRPFLPREGKELQNLDKMLEFMYVPAYRFDENKSTTQNMNSGFQALDGLFCKDPWRLKALLTCAFAPNFMSGIVKANKPANEEGEHMLGEFLRQGFDPMRSIVVAVQGGGPRNTDWLEGMKETLRMITANGCIDMAIVDDTNKLLVSLADDDETSARQPGMEIKNTAVGIRQTCSYLNEESGLVQTLPHAAQLICGHCDSHARFKAPLLSSGRQPSGGVTISKPASPYELLWHFMSHQNQEAHFHLERSRTSLTKTNQPNLSKFAFKSPIGLLASCGVDIHDEPQDGWGPNNLPMPAICQAFGVYFAGPVGSASGASAAGATLLTSEADGLLSVVLLVAFLRHHHKLDFVVDQSNGVVEAVRIQGSSDIQLREQGRRSVFLVEDVHLVNKLRFALSKAMGTLSQSLSPVGAHDDNLENARFRDSCEHLGIVALLEPSVPSIISSNVHPVSVVLQELRESLLQPRDALRTQTAGQTLSVSMHESQAQGSPFFRPYKDLMHMAKSRPKLPAIRLTAPENAHKEESGFKEELHKDTLDDVIASGMQHHDADEATLHQVDGIEWSGQDESWTGHEEESSAEHHYGEAGWHEQDRDFDTHDSTSWGKYNQDGNEGAHDWVDQDQDIEAQDVTYTHDEQEVSHDLQQYTSDFISWNNGSDNSSEKLEGWEDHGYENTNSEQLWHTPDPDGDASWNQSSNEWNQVSNEELQTHPVYEPDGSYWEDTEGEQPMGGHAKYAHNDDNGWAQAPSAKRVRVGDTSSMLFETNESQTWHSASANESMENLELWEDTTAVDQASDEFRHGVPPFSRKQHVKVEPAAVKSRVPIPAPFPKANAGWRPSRS